MTAQTYGGHGWVDGGDGMFFFFYFSTKRFSSDRQGDFVWDHCNNIDPIPSCPFPAGT